MTVHPVSEALCHTVHVTEEHCLNTNFQSAALLANLLLSCSVVFNYELFLLLVLSESKLFSSIYR